MKILVNSKDLKLKLTTMMAATAFRKCFICHNNTENRKTRRRGYATSFCRLFDLPNLPYENEILDKAIFCPTCHENIQKIENLFLKLEKVKEDIVNFRILIEEQITQTDSIQVPSRETIAFSECPDPSTELRKKIISKIQFTAPVPDNPDIETDPRIFTRSRIKESNQQNFSKTVSNDQEDEDNESYPESQEIKFENIEGSPAHSDIQEDFNENEDNNDVDSDKSKASDDSDSSHNSYDSVVGGVNYDYAYPYSRGGLPTKLASRRTTRSQTARMKLSDSRIEVKYEYESDEDDSQENFQSPDMIVKSETENNLIDVFSFPKKSNERQSRKAEESLEGLTKIRKRKKSKKSSDKRSKKKKIKPIMVWHYRANRPGWLKCPKENCKFSFPDQVAVEAHIRRLHEGVKKPYVCTEPGCDKAFKHPSDLEQHKIIHTGVKAFICEYCAKEFFTAKNLQIHTDTAHNNHKLSLRCKYCDKGFKGQAVLDIHLRKHTKEAPYLCYCGKRYISEHTFKTHQRAHNNEFQCSVCNRALSNQGSLDEHMRQHTGLYPFICELCGLGLTNKTRLAEHMESHEGIKVECSVCKLTVARRSLKSHMKTHDPGRPKNCVCEQCGKAFVDNYKLNRHKQYHLGNKAFKCTVCEKGFYTKDYLNVHMKYHEKSGASLRNQTRKPRIWKHSVLPNPNVEENNDNNPNKNI